MDKSYLNFAEKIVKGAGSLLWEMQKKFEIVTFKDRQDIATTADLAAEKYLMDIILKTYPDHGILSEEAGEVNPEADYKWVIDPLDGTKEYVRMVPHWNCSLALEYQNETIAAVVYRPHEKVLYSAALGQGSFRNGESIKPSDHKKLDDSFVYCYLPAYQRNKENYDTAFNKLQSIGKKVYRLRSTADENSALCWLAGGGCEAYINLSNPAKYHDVAPGLFVAREAGAFNAKSAFPLVVTNNTEIYNQLRELL